MRTPSLVVMATWNRSLVLAIFAVVPAIPGLVFAQTHSPGAPEVSASEIERSIAAAERAALLGVAIPAGAGAAFSIVTQPGGKTNVPTWQVATIASLFGIAATWGVSMGYYQSGQTGYATLSGVAKAALIGGAVFVDDKANFEGPPFATILALGGVIGWDFWDYHRLDTSIRERARAKSTSSLSPLMAVRSTEMMLGLCGQF
jgi:hypothetical protein